MCADSGGQPLDVRDEDVELGTRTCARVSQGSPVTPGGRHRGRSPGWGAAQLPCTLPPPGDPGGHGTPVCVIMSTSGREIYIPA